MITAWVLVLAAGGAGSGSAFDPKAYIQTLPTEDEDEGDIGVGDEAEKPPAKPAESLEVVKRADLKVDGKLVVALKSAFGTIYIAKADGITPASLDAAVCASAKPEPTDVAPDRPLDGADRKLEGAIIKAIETHCRPAKAAGQGDKIP